MDRRTKYLFIGALLGGILIALTAGQVADAATLWVPKALLR